MRIDARLFSSVSPGKREKVLRSETILSGSVNRRDCGSLGIHLTGEDRMLSRICSAIARMKLGGTLLPMR